MVPHLTQRRIAAVQGVTSGMTSYEAPAQRPPRQTAGTGAHAQSQVQADNRNSEASPTRPNLSRLDTYSEMRIFFYHNPVNVLLVFVPVGIVAGSLGLPAEAVFWLNFVAVIPLAPMIRMAVLKLSSDNGRTRGGLLRAAFGNMAELMVRIPYPPSPSYRFLTPLICQDLYSRFDQQSNSTHQVDHSRKHFVLLAPSKLRIALLITSFSRRKFRFSDSAFW